MLKRKSIGILATLLALTLVLSACGAATPPASSAAPAPAPAAPAASGAPAAPATPAPTAPAEKLSIFYHTSGTGVPDKFDYKNNDVMNKIAQLANVEFTEATVPAYSDLKTKFNLMMASGSIPDIVIHNSVADMNQYGKDGAFVELSEIIKNSPAISAKYTPAMLEACKADDGKLYALRSLPTSDGWHLLVRNDMLKAAGVNTIPSTLDGWVEAMKAVKAKFPDCIPYTSMGAENYLQFLFKPYGCESGWGWQYVNGKVANVFENPNLGSAIEFGKKLLAEGLLDPEFATTTQQDYTDKRWKNNVLLVSASLASFPGSTDLMVKNQVEHTEFIPVQWPFVNPDTLDPYQKFVPSNVVNNQCIAISSSCKNPEAAARVIEALLSEELLDMVVNGREGIEFTVKDGKKVIDPVKHAESNWRSIYGVMYSYNPIEKIRLKGELSLAAMKETDEFKAAYKKDYEKAFGDLYAAEYGKVGYAPVAVSARTMNTLIPLSNDSNAQSKEAIAKQQSILLKALMGEISMDEFNKQAAEVVKKYQGVTDEFNKKLPDCKAKYNIK